MSLTLRDASGAEIACTWWPQSMPVPTPQPENGQVYGVYNGLRVAHHTPQSQSRTTHIQDIYILCDRVSVLEELVNEDAYFPPFLRGQALAPSELLGKFIDHQYEVRGTVFKVDPVQPHYNTVSRKMSEKQEVYLRDSSGTATGARCTVCCTVYKITGFRPFEVGQVVAMREVSLVAVTVSKIQLSVLAGHTARSL